MSRRAGRRRGAYRVTSPKRNDDGPTDIVLPAVGWRSDPATQRLIGVFGAAGVAVRAVGGAVRDALAGRPVGDVDLATPLAPADVVALVRGAGLTAIPTGADHGTITAVVDRHPFEITTLRRDVETDGRHAVVAFTDDWREDAARRDFTINALSADPDGRVYDYFGGLCDLAAGRVRFVGDADLRVREDYLRLLRYFRFFARYGREPADAAALAAAVRHAGCLDRLSGERLHQELAKLLAPATAAAPSDAVAAWRLMTASGVAAALIGEDGDADRLARLIGLAADADWLVRLAALVTRADAADRLAQRLVLSRKEAERLAGLAGPDRVHLDTPAAAAARRAAYDRRHPDRRLALVADALLLAAADAADPAPWLGARADLLAAPPPPFPIGGQDGRALGLPGDARLGALLSAVEDWWIAGDFAGDRAACLAELARRAA